MIETIAWKETAKEMPDEDILVLAIDCLGDVTAACVESGQWLDLNASCCEMEPPEFWAHMPAGPVKQG
jgi:hypothetical protein